MDTNKYVCIHGHFYQPPRENPWTNKIDIQPSAAPYPNWNDRILHECYKPNAASVILNPNGTVYKTQNNYSFISHNFGPTLLDWMASEDMSTYDRIIAADRLSQVHFGGYGSAMAQIYNHVIMPLATPIDKALQIAWGILDFTNRYGRKPDGMWLAETAADIATLESLANAGIKFTILSPTQASRVRPAANSPWQSILSGQLDTTHPYRVNLPNNQTIAVFFYNGEISQAIAFENLLQESALLVDRLKSGFRDGIFPQLVHIATDGESYGHHHKFGDMALAATIEKLYQDPSVRLTNYAEYLANFPPTWEVEIISPSAWSCAHGVARWQSDCGCNTGSQPGWNQKWRTGLRKSLATLNHIAMTRAFDCLSLITGEDPLYVASQILPLASDDHIQSLFPQFLKDSTATSIGKFSWAVQVIRNAQFMMTSCGWFFADISGIESIQLMRYAARTLDLMDDCQVESQFRSILQTALSNLPSHGTGEAIFSRFARPEI